MKLPSILAFEAPFLIEMPLAKSFMTSPCTSTLEASIVIPSNPEALVPSSSMSSFALVPTNWVFSVAPGWE